MLGRRSLFHEEISLLLWTQVLIIPSSSRIFLFKLEIGKQKSDPSYSEALKGSGGVEEEGLIADSDEILQREREKKRLL